MPNPFVHPAHPLASITRFHGPGPTNAGRRIILLAVPPGPLHHVPLGFDWRQDTPVNQSATPGRGAVLCDETGQLFERIGDYVRPLGPLSPVVFDPNGHRAQPPFFQAFERQGQPFPDTRSEADAGRGAQAAGSAPTAEAAAPPSRLRPILEDPGRRCIVSFGDFKPLLASQLSHPERLRDGHRLDCHVQVYEATTPMRLRSITDVGPLCPLTKEIAARLALNDLVGEPNRRPVRPAPDVVVPGERLFLLKPIDDPTLATSAQPSEPPAPRPAVQQPERVPAPRTTIPERFLKPWELRLDREDALDAIDRERGLFRRLIEGLRSWGRRRELRRWQVLLSGHSADEQLWGIQPPRGGLHSHLVRDWARHTLRLAGYDARTMLLEWEVFWRRKGL